MRLRSDGDISPMRARHGPRHGTFYSMLDAGHIYIYAHKNAPGADAASRRRDADIGFSRRATSPRRAAGRPASFRRQLTTSHFYALADGFPSTFSPS